MGYNDRNQSIKKIEKIKKVIDYFDTNGGTINEISEALNIPKSSVQRYLNDKLVEELTTKECATKIKEYLLHMKEYGNKLGGINSQNNNNYQKNEQGKFTGSIRK